MRTDSRFTSSDILRKGSIILVALICFSTLVYAVTFKGLHPSPQANWAMTAEYSKSLNMISAHEVLRRPEVADADSLSNRIALETMLKKALQSGKSDPPLPPDLPLINSELVGTLQGDFSVDNKGTGEFEAELPIPDGRGTLTPQLTLSYSSRSGDGIIGRGFYISNGFHSKITRGRSLLAREGVVRGIEHDVSDNFFLDGKLLVCTTAPSSYGYPGSVYRTEVDSFQTITAAGENDEIETFELKNKWGRIYTFGKYQGHEDALHRPFSELDGALSQTTYAFALKRVEDSLGNFVDLDYEHMGNGDWELKAMHYTGFKDQAPSFRIDYHYRALTYPSMVYAGLGRLDQTQVLESVTVTSIQVGETVAKFDFNYYPLTADRTLRLKEVRTHLAADIGAPLEQIAPTRFIWSNAFDANASFSRFQTSKLKLKSKHPARTHIADFNGDGKKDFMKARPTLEVFLSTAEGFGKVSRTWISNSKLRSKGDSAPQVSIIDFNGDGMKDVALQFTEKIEFFVSTGSAFERVADLGSLDDRDVILGDFTGDGRTDVVLRSNTGSLELHTSLGSSLDGPISSRLETPRTGQLVAYEVIDLNGDGRDDVVFRQSDSAAGQLSVSYQLSLPDSRFSRIFPLKTWLGKKDDPVLRFGDFNDDDLPDLLSATKDEAGRWNWELTLNKSHPTSLLDPDVRTSKYIRSALPLPNLPISFTPHPEPEASTTEIVNRIHNSITTGILPIILDVNRDGYDDLILPGNSDGIWTLSLADARGSFHKETDLPLPLAEAFSDLSEFGQISMSLQDINGDGISDFLVESRNALGETAAIAAINCLNTAPSSSHLSNMLTGMVDGYGKITCVAYKASKDDTVYTPGAEVEFPIRESRNNLPVVSDVWRDETGGEFLQYSYQYSGQRTDLSARGSLGFASFTTIDRQSGFLSFQQVIQSFPMTGLVTQEEVYLTREEGKKIHLKLVGIDRNSVLFDAVVDPYLKRYYATIYPYTSSSVELDWLDDEVWDYTFPKSELTDYSTEKSVLKNPVSDQPRYSKTIEHWYDQHDTDSSPLTKIPEVSTAYVLEKSKSQREPLLPGLIHYANKTRESTNYGYGFVEYDNSTYEAPKGPSDPFVSRRKSFESKRIPDISGEESQAPTTYTYFPNSTLWASYIEDRRNHEDSEDKTLEETHYIRDERGRLLERYDLSEEEDENGERIRTVTYTASDYDDLIDRPETEAYADGEKRWITYNPLFRAARQTNYERGITVSTSFDPLGRKTWISNISYNYQYEAQYVWTTSEKSEWQMTQIILPPKGVDAHPARSRWAERFDESQEPTLITYYDRTGRQIREITIEEDTVTYVDSIYNKKGYLAAETEPYELVGPKTWILKHYDGYGVLTDETEKKLLSDAQRL